MRLLHTADWHLGRSLGGHALIEDQMHVLGISFMQAVADLRPDAVLIAGDIFDRAVPPAEAVELLDDILHRIVLGLRIPVVMIPGNHDEARRLSFGARLLAGAGLHILDSPMGRAVHLADAHGTVAIIGAGYASPLTLAQYAEGRDFADHDAGFAWLAPQLIGLCGDSRRKVLVAHGFVAGGAESESERGIAVGGTGQIGAARFAGFDYVALGHLHRPQTLAGGRLRYSGSPLPYSISEAGQAKSATLVTLDAEGGATLEEIPLAPMRALRLLSGRFSELGEAPLEGREDWLSLTLTDPTPIPDAQRHLAKIFPRIIGFRYAEQMLAAMRFQAPSAATRAARPIELFADFHQTIRGKPLPDEALPVLRAAITTAEAAEA